jgi:hypothetical protein
MGQHDTPTTKEPTMTNYEDLDIGDLLTGPEIAHLGGVKMATFERWRLRNQGTDKTLPEPFWHFGLTPVWYLPILTAWMDETGRSYDVANWRKARDAGEFRRRTPSNAKAS